jgi:hypothetical protein
MRESPIICSLRLYTFYVQPRVEDLVTLAQRGAKERLDRSRTGSEDDADVAASCPTGFVDESGGPGRTNQLCVAAIEYANVVVDAEFSQHVTP